jgi:tetratricopeptide (TPR) repeat protein
MRAEDAREAAAGLRDALAGRGAAEWGGDDWTTVLQSIARGDEDLDEGVYGEAALEYETALAALETLDARADEVLEDSLRRGREALGTGDAASASAAFALAGRVDPGNVAAARGSSRAAVLDDVFALLADGRRRERRGDLIGAEVSYRRATEIDPASGEARAALEQVRERARDDAFTRVLAEGLAALDRDDTDAAREAFQHAEAVRPGSAEVAEGMARVEELENLGAVARLRQQAEKLESDERWSDAAAVYASAIEIDPALRFARDGRERCLDRANLRASLDFHLEHPERLATDEVHREASLLLARAREAEPAGPIHRGQMDRLELLLRKAVVPVVVRLVSDGLTQVTVFRVGRLGTFESRELELRPGTYTVVGTRRGFRDVRHRLVVAAGEDPGPLVVRCEEAI